MTVHEGVALAQQLIAREAGLRQSARVLELIPARRSDALRLYHQATRLRAERLEVLAQCGLI